MSEHKRKCWDCGNVAIHEDSIVPWVNCPKCGSQDTRPVRKPVVTKLHQSNCEAELSVAKLRVAELEQKAAEDAGMVHMLNGLRKASDEAMLAAQAENARLRELLAKAYAYIPRRPQIAPGDVAYVNSAAVPGWNLSDEIYELLKNEGNQQSQSDAQLNNINNLVQVKLTKHALEVHEKLYHDMSARLDGHMRCPPYSPPKVDADGWYTIELWQLMADFGPDLNMNSPQLFVNNEIRIAKS